jgi:antitoxin component of RelBE/YafQ-DinJ toxin-antitoxin module
MDAIVAARVPVEVKERGNSMLASIGATPTQLINAAYRYVLAFGSLPCAEHDGKPTETGTTRRLSAEQRERLEAQMRSLKVSGHDYSQGGARTLKQAIEEKRKAEHAALA